MKQSKDVNPQRKPCNINDRDATLEAMQELRRMAQFRMVMDDNSDETWAMLMGAKALDKLKLKRARTEQAKPRSVQRVIRQTFDDWWMDVIIIARLLGFKEKQRATLDKEAWKEGYYNEHFTAAEAWQCECESA